MPQKRTSSRRDFLTGRSAVEAVGDLAAGGEPGAITSLPPPIAPGEGFLVEFARSAMACKFAIHLNAGQYDGGSDAALAALDLVDELESQLTVYRETSELSDLNRRAAAEAVEVEARLFELLQQSLELSESTGGAFDITAGPLTKAWGFYRRQGRIPSDDELRAAQAAVDWRQVALDAHRRCVRFLRPGIELNLGSIGKGYTLDRCAELLADRGVDDFIMHGGNSSVLARGAHASRTGGEGGWVVGVGHPLRPERQLAELVVRDRALATSGSGTQFFRHQGRRYGHIIDPRTGWPAEGVISTTVLAPSAAVADALATAFYVLGREAAEAYCQQHPEIALLMLLPSTSGSRVELVTVGLAEADWRRCDQPQRD